MACLVQHKLWRERREAAIEAFVKSLRDKAKVEEHLEMLAQVKVPAPIAPEAPGKPLAPVTAPARPVRGPAPVARP